MIKLPDDVRELIAKKKRGRTIVFLLTEAAFLSIIAMLGERMFGVLGEYSPILFYSAIAAVIVSPVFICGLPRMRADKSFSGIVEAVSVKTRHVGDKDPNRHSQAKIVQVNIVELCVRLDNGSTKVIELNMWTKRPEHFLGDYKIGFRVYHFSGLDGYLVIDPERDDLAYCAVCHGRESSEKVRCNHCGHTLVKFKKQ